MAIDFSDLGGQPVNDQKGIDFSDLGGVPVGGGRTAPPTQPQSFLGNAMQDIKGDLSSVNRIGKGILDLPKDAYQTGKQVLAGGALSQTPLGQDVQTVGTAVRAAVPHLEYGPNGGYVLDPGAVVRQFQDIGAQPLKMIPGKVGEEFQKYYPGNPFYEHPVNTALALAPAAKPLLGAAAEPVGEALQGTAQNFGRRALGLSKRFLGKTEDQLPAANQAAQTALDQGVIRNPIFHPFSSGAEDMLSRANALEDKAGQRIGDYLESQGTSFQVKPVVDQLEDLKTKFYDDPDAVKKINAAQRLLTKNADIIDTSDLSEPNFTGMQFDKASGLKRLFQKKVNYNTDAAAQDVGKSVAGTVRGGIDQQLEDAARRGGTGSDFENFVQNKNLYGQSQIMQKGLLNKAAGESGNLPVSPYSILIGMGEGLKGGSFLKGAATALASEWAKRYGAATAATMANSTAKLFLTNPEKYSTILSNVGPTVSAIESVLNQDPEFRVILPQGQQPIFKQPPKAASIFNKPKNQQLAMARVPPDVPDTIVTSARG